MTSYSSIAASVSVNSDSPVTEQIASSSIFRHPPMVYVSYLGPDVKRNVISYLRLCPAEVEMFINSDDVPKGESISVTNSSKMRSATVYVIILSLEYFNSVKHLNDLVKMHQFVQMHRQNEGRIIFPVYFNLTRSDLLSELSYFDDRQKRFDYIRRQGCLRNPFRRKDKHCPEDHPYVLALEKFGQETIGSIRALRYLSDIKGLEVDSKVDGGEKMTEFFNSLKQILKKQGNLREPPRPRFRIWLTVTAEGMCPAHT